MPGDVSPHALIQSFITGLSDFLTTLVAPGAAKPTRTIVFTSATTAIQNWTADADYYLVGCTANTASIQVLSRDGTPTTILTAVDRVNSGGAIIAQNFAGTIFGIRAFIPSGSKLYWAPAASGEFCNAFLQYA